MLNKPYKTLLATLVLATGLSVVPASTVQAKMVRITLKDGTEVEMDESEVESFVAQHYKDMDCEVVDSDEGSVVYDEDDEDTKPEGKERVKLLEDKDGNLVKGKNGVYYSRDKVSRYVLSERTITQLDLDGLPTERKSHMQTFARDLDGNKLYEVGKKTPFKKPANGSFYAIKGTDDLFIYDWKSGGSKYFAYNIGHHCYTMEQYKWLLEASRNPGYQRNDILPYLKVTCSKPDMLKITDRKNGGKSFKWVKTGTCKITLELDSYKISYPVKVLSNTMKNNKLAIKHNVVKKGMSINNDVNHRAMVNYMEDIISKPIKKPWYTFELSDKCKYKDDFVSYKDRHKKGLVPLGGLIYKKAEWMKKHKALVTRSFVWTYIEGAYGTESYLYEDGIESYADYLFDFECPICPYVSLAVKPYW
ncbi:hypothetical protein SAMN02910400_00246 [Lachnospiraceae bacterium C10]|nr:hypothetical protein SAMN02910400_00246 [Lachnospiraceae bacterium C10]